MDKLDNIKKDILDNGVKDLSILDFNQITKKYNLTSEEEIQLDLWARENHIYSFDVDVDNIGIYLNGYLRLTDDDMKVLLKIIHYSEDEAQVKKAKERFVEGNLGLVKSIAKKYESINKEVSLEDLIQEGTIGLMKAMDKFEYEQGNKFSTYATYWIKDAIFKGNEKGNVKIPVHIQMEISDYKKIKKDYPGASQEELMEITGYSADKILKLEQYIQMQSVSSMNQTATDDGDTEIIDLIEDKNKETIGDNLITNMSMDYYQKEFERMMSEFTDRQKNIFLSIFRDGMSYEDVANQEGISTSRVRQIATMVQSRMAKKISEDVEFQALIEDILK